MRGIQFYRGAQGHAFLQGVGGSHAGRLTRYSGLGPVSDSVSFGSYRPDDLDAQTMKLARQWRRKHPNVQTATPVTHWLKQFDTPEDRQLALKLLQQFKYFGLDDIRCATRTMHQWLLKQPGIDPARVRYAAFAPGKSGGLMLYFYRQANDLPVIRFTVFPLSQHVKEPFPGEDTLVMIDDFLGSGKEAAYYFEDNRETISRYKRVFFMTPVAYREGLDLLSKKFPHVKVFAPFQPYRILEPGNPAFSAAEKARIPEFLNRYAGRTLPERNLNQTVTPLGYRNGASLVAFEYNTPSNVPPIFWAENARWKPLFRRFMSRDF